MRLALGCWPEAGSPQEQTAHYMQHQGVAGGVQGVVGEGEAGLGAVHAWPCPCGSCIMDPACTMDAPHTSPPATYCAACSCSTLAPWACPGSVACPASAVLPPGRQRAAMTVGAVVYFHGLQRRESSSRHSSCRNSRGWCTVGAEGVECAEKYVAWAQKAAAEHTNLLWFMGDVFSERRAEWKSPLCRTERHREGQRAQHGQGGRQGDRHAQEATRVFGWAWGGGVG